MSVTPVSSDLDLQQHRIFNAAFQASSIAPPAPIRGQRYMDTSVSPPVEKYWNGTAWVEFSAAGFAAALAVSAGTIKFVKTAVNTTSATPLTITHSLNTNSVSVTVWSAATGGTLVPVDGTVTAVANVTANAISITTSLDQTGLMVVVIG